MVIEYKCIIQNKKLVMVHKLILINNVIKKLLEMMICLQRHL